VPGKEIEMTAQYIDLTAEQWLMFFNVLIEE
jgi:hypothetical protein